MKKIKVPIPKTHVPSIVKGQYVRKDCPKCNGVGVIGLLGNGPVPFVNCECMIEIDYKALERAANTGCGNIALDFDDYG
jgi:hypothetical protein